MENHAALMEELNRYYAVWQETNYVYTEWAKAHGISVSCLLALTAIDEGGEDCTQKKISQRWLIPKHTVNMILKDFERQKFVELLPMQGGINGISASNSQRQGGPMRTRFCPNCEKPSCP